MTVLDTWENIVRRLNSGVVLSITVGELKYLIDTAKQHGSESAGGINES